MPLLQLGEHFFKRVGDVFEEDQAEYDVFVFGGIDVFAQFVGGFPELLFQWLFFAGCGREGTGHWLLSLLAVEWATLIY
jgi:hypothetical protein